ncbi:hypothetical protein ACO2RV_18945 [Ancylobacter sp. VNQ12]|uniref:hypothetical protein n=1 Tax=Ancylobacter sp. VNQ12 TaxID=3400920 RepID=UPI003C0173E5
MDGWIKSELPADVVSSAVTSEDDVGVFLRSHHLVEQAAEKAAEKLYEQYSALGHDTLSKHLNALFARGAAGEVFQAAKVVAKHRRDFAHTRIFEITENHVAAVGNLIRLPTQIGLPIADKTVPYDELRPARRYLVLCILIAGSIERLGNGFHKAVRSAEKVHVETGAG